MQKIQTLGEYARSKSNKNAIMYKKVPRILTLTSTDKYYSRKKLCIVIFEEGVECS